MSVFAFSIGWKCEWNAEVMSTNEYSFQDVGMHVVTSAAIWRKSSEICHTIFRISTFIWRNSDFRNTIYALIKTSR